MIMKNTLKTLLFTLALLACVACASDSDSNTEKQDTSGGSPPGNTPNTDNPPANNNPNTDTPNNTPNTDNPPANNTPNNTPNTLGNPYQFIPEGEDGEFECRAGDYDSDSDGKKDFSIDCWPNGNRKSRVEYYWIEYTHTGDIYYEGDGVTKSSEKTYYESNGNRKTVIYYPGDGTKQSSKHYCFEDDGNTREETCTMEKHGCTIYHYSCIDTTLYGGGLTDCLAGSFDTDSDSDGKKDFSITCHDNGNRKARMLYRQDGTKYREYTYWENGNLKADIYYRQDGTKSNEGTYWGSNGNRKAGIGYFSDGVTKNVEYTYYESNGRQKTVISYLSDGTKSAGYPKCYKDDGNTEETCTLAKHDCNVFHYSCIPNCTYYTNGSPQACIYYRSDGVTKSSESTYTYYENGNRKSRIDYLRDGVTRRIEYTYYESNGNLKTEQRYSAVSDCCAPACYEDDDSRETCTMEKHGCTSESDTCIQ